MHVPVMRYLVDTLQQVGALELRCCAYVSFMDVVQWNYTVCAVQLIDSQYLGDAAKFMSGRSMCGCTLSLTSVK